MNQTLLDKFDYSPKVSKTTILKRVKSLLRKRKYLITDQRVINYSDSPTGKAFVGVSKAPLMRVKEGFGYQGVLLQTNNRVLVQCHICGKWLRFLTPTHLEKHGLTPTDYKVKFGLYTSKGLVSDEMSYSLAERARENIENYNNLQEGIAKAAHFKGLVAIKNAKQMRNSLTSAQYKNKYGTCEQQIGFRLVEWIKTYKELPSRSTPKGDGRAISKVLVKRYGSVNEGFKHYGLPVRHRSGTNVELVAPNKKQLFFNYNKFFDRTKIYQWMIKQCPFLHPDAINMFADQIVSQNKTPIGN